MKILILARLDESKILTNLGQAISIRVVHIKSDQVLIDIESKTLSEVVNEDLPIMLRQQAD